MFHRSFTFDENSPTTKIPVPAKTYLRRYFIVLKTLITQLLNANWAKNLGELYVFMTSRKLFSIRSRWVREESKLSKLYKKLENRRWFTFVYLWMNLLSRMNAVVRENVLDSHFPLWSRKISKIICVAGLLGIMQFVTWFIRAYRLCNSFKWAVTNINFHIFHLNKFIYSLWLQ